MQDTKDWSERSLLGKAVAYTLAIGILIFSVVCPHPLWPEGPERDSYR